MKQQVGGVLHDSGSDRADTLLDEAARRASDASSMRKKRTCGRRKLIGSDSTRAKDIFRDSQPPTSHSPSRSRTRDA